VYAGHGNDYVSGGSENGTILGQAGDDRVIGGTHDDRLWGGAGADRVLGGDGGDYLAASTQSIVAGGGGTDRIYLHDEGGSAPRLSDPSGYEVQAGDAADVVDARDGERSDVDCGAGVDRLLGDPGDRAVRCESRSERPR